MSFNRNHDYENFLCTLLIKGDQRRGAFAVRAFNVEVSKIISAVITFSKGLCTIDLIYI